MNLPIALTEAETNSTREAHCQNCSGALIEAARRWHFHVVDILLQYGAFDYGNRAINELTNLLSEENQLLELISLFLQHLAFVDAENRKMNVDRKYQFRDDGIADGDAEGTGLRVASGAINKISRVAGNLLLSRSIPSGEGGREEHPLKGCQLNWKATGIRELRLEWLIAASSRLNQFPNIHYPK